MHFNILTPVLVVLIFAQGKLTEAAQDESGCAATGMKPYDYGQALCMSNWFYEAQRTGKLPANGRVSWRGDSCLDDGQDNGVDLSGGYFDAGDFMKFSLPLAFFVTTFSWGMVEYASGYATAGQTADGQATIRWATDYLLKCHGGRNVLWAQVGDGDDDAVVWCRPEDLNINRPSYKLTTSNPGSDMAGEHAAALAAASMVLADDASYANQLLDMAKEMLDFGDQYRELYQNSIPKADQFYASGFYGDDLAWGAAWLYKATGQQTYLNRAEGFVDEFYLLNQDGINFYWSDKLPGVYAMMAELSSDAKYGNRLQSYMDEVRSYNRYTTNGLIFIQHWGSLRHAMGLAFIAQRAAALGIDTRTNNDWAEGQLSYALGSQGHSFIVGFGVNPPTHAHHRAASCNDPPAPCSFEDMNKVAPNPHVLFGALVGGPTDQRDTWQDNRSNWEMTEVGLDYNSCYSGLLARMIELNY